MLISNIIGNFMHQNEVKELFDKQAETYDQQWSNTAPIRHCMHLLLRSVFADLPVNANILCIGVGTGDELLYLASNFPNWQFTAVEPSGPMLDICKKRAKESGVDTRCIFHEGYLHSMPFEQDFELVMGRKIEVVTGNTIALQDNQLSLPSAQLSTAQKRALWQLIWSQQDAS